MTLGRTGIEVFKDGLGALPLQRNTVDDAVALIKKCVDGGINYIDTARAYTDSEEKLGLALGGKRRELVIATKTGAGDVKTFWEHLETSLRLLKTDYIDVYQFHNPQYIPRPGDDNGMYAAMLEAKAQGKILHIGITNHRLDLALEAARSGLYEVLQFPFSYLASDGEIDLVRECEKLGVGFVCMKALAGGLLTDVAAARAWISQYPNALPIWGLQRFSEWDKLAAAIADDSPLTPDQSAKIERDRAELLGEFCRGCGYCMPCPADIQINMAARVSLLIRRAPTDWWLSDGWAREMDKIDNCINCGNCKAHCPYGLDTPELLRKNLADYKEVRQCGSV